MKIALLLIGIAIVLLVAPYAIRFFHLLTVSENLVKNTVPYENLSEDTSIAILVLGDSTAVGVGASQPSESLPARVAKAVDATYVENHAVSGAVVADLSSQIQKAKRSTYTYILVQIGANDIVRFHNPTETAQELALLLNRLPQSEHVFVVSAGDVGTATVLPEVVRPFYTRLTNKYHQEFARMLSAEGITYIDLSKTPRAELFKTQPKVYLAADEFHPSSAGYQIWFEAMQPYLSK